MSIKKCLPIILVVIAIVLIIGTGRAQAHFSELAAVSTSDEPYLSQEILFTARDNKQEIPAVAYNWKHDEYLVVWQNTWGASRDIYAQRVTGQGEVLEWFDVAPTAPLHPYPNDRVQPSVAYDPVNDRYLVAWAYDTPGDGSNWDIHGIFVNWDGPIPGLHEFKICVWTTQQKTPKVAYARAAEEFMIVWETNPSSTPGYISGRRMKASDGTMPTSGSDFTIYDDKYIEKRINPEIAYNLARNEYLVVYDDTQDIYGTRFTGKGQPLGGGEFPIATWLGAAETQPSVAACKETDQYLVAWQNPQPDIYARFVKGDGSLDPTILHFASTSVDQINPQVACNSAGNRFLVVWQEQYSSATGPYGVRGQFVNNNKTLESDFEIMAPTGGIPAEFTNPAVAGGGVNYLAVWEHDRAGTVLQDIHGILITKYVVFLPSLMRNHP